MLIMLGLSCSYNSRLDADVQNTEYMTLITKIDLVSLLCITCLERDRYVEFKRKQLPVKHSQILAGRKIKKRAGHGGLLISSIINRCASDWLISDDIRKAAGRT